MLKLENVSLFYEDFQVLENIEFSLNPGEWIAILGGSGKSSLLRVMGGLEIPQTGSVHFLGVDLYRSTERKYSELQTKTGFQFQNAALLANVSLFENIALPLRYHYQIKEEELRQRVSQVLARLNLSSLKIDQRPASFSLGVRKMIGLARAMILNPVLFFFDDPASNLDRLGRQTLVKVMLEEKANGTSGIFVSDDLDLLTLIADRLLVLDEGKIVVDGSFEEVLNSSNSRIQKIIGSIMSEKKQQAMHLDPRLDREKESE